MQLDQNEDTKNVSAIEIKQLPFMTKETFNTAKGSTFMIKCISEEIFYLKSVDLF